MKRNYNYESGRAQHEAEKGSVKGFMSAVRHNRRKMAVQKAKMK